MATLRICGPAIDAAAAHNAEIALDYGIFNELSKCCRGADSQRAIFRLCYSPQLCQIVDINNMAIAVIVMVKLYQYVSATAAIWPADCQPAG